MGLTKRPEEFRDYAAGARGSVKAYTDLTNARDQPDVGELRPFYEELAEEFFPEPLAF